MDKSLIDKRYELRGLAGSGGMADVYLAHDSILDRDVALKLLKEQYAQNEEFVERFRREARNAASLSHPNIVPIFDWGETGDGTYYIAMEYLPGGTLKDHLMSKGALPTPTLAAVEVALEIVEALRAAHEQGIIHRDIKPRNILITDLGHLKVGDFGIARAAEATTISDLGDILGSVNYMSPEQAMGEPVGPASDLYSLGVVLYEMLTGRVPFEVATPAEVPLKHAAGELPPNPKEINPKVPEDVDALVMKLLARDPAERYASAQELIEELGRVRRGDDLSGVVVSSGDDASTVALESPAASTLPAPAPGTSEAHRSSRKWSLIVAAFALLAVLGAVGGALGWDSLRDPGLASIPEILRSAPEGLSVGTVTKPSRLEESRVPGGVEGSTGQEARGRLAQSLTEDADRVLEHTMPGRQEAKENSKVSLTVSETPEVARVPNLVGLSYPEAENALQESGFLLGGVKEAPSETVPEGVIIAQSPPPGTTLDTNSYVYLTTSVGPPERGGAGGAREEKPGVVSGSRHSEPSSQASSQEDAVAGAIRGHYQAIGAANFEEAYSYFGPTMRSRQDEASWISSERSYEIQSSTIHSLRVEEVSGRRATATVDVSFVDNTGTTPRFVIVWGLVKEGGAWKLDEQFSAQRVTRPQPDSLPTSTATPTVSPSASPAPSGADVLPVREENQPPSYLVKVNQSEIYHGVLRRVRGGGKILLRVVAQEA